MHTQCKTVEAFNVIEMLYAAGFFGKHKEQYAIRYRLLSANCYTMFSWYNCRYFTRHNKYTFT